MAWHCSNIVIQVGTSRMGLPGLSHRILQRVGTDAGLYQLHVRITYTGVGPVEASPFFETAARQLEMGLAM